MVTQNSKVTALVDPGGEGGGLEVSARGGGFPEKLERGFEGYLGFCWVS